jgi:hypothetical protein
MQDRCGVTGRDAQPELLDGLLGDPDPVSKLITS